MREGVQATESDDILSYFHPKDADELREESKELEVPVNYLIALAAQYARHTLYNQIANSETNPIPAELRPSR